jgi:glycosyltransferase involved in cell wall biosynthesis
MPLISIITITYNAEKFLEKTIKSIIRQTTSDYEYILIDGGSNDKTLEIVNKYASVFSKIISEPDNGLYDAMNKGLSNAKGDYVWFMNAGDEIAEADAITKIKKLISQNADIVYGETQFVDTESLILGIRSELGPHKLPQKLDWAQYGMGMLVCHQAFIVKRSIAPNYILNNLSADIDWEIKCIKNSNFSLKYEGILANYLEGGVSHQSMYKSWKDRYVVLRNHFGFTGNLINHIKIIIRADFKNIFRLSKYIK